MSIKDKLSMVKEAGICYVRNNVFYPKLEKHIDSWSTRGGLGGIIWGPPVEHYKEYFLPKYLKTTVAIDALIAGSLANNLILPEFDPEIVVLGGVVAGAIYGLVSPLVGAEIVEFSRLKKKNEK